MIDCKLISFVLHMIAVNLLLSFKSRNYKWKIYFSFNYYIYLSNIHLAKDNTLNWTHYVGSIIHHHTGIHQYKFFLVLKAFRFDSGCMLLRLLNDWHCFGSCKTVRHELIICLLKKNIFRFLFLKCIIFLIAFAISLFVIPYFFVEDNRNTGLVIGRTRLWKQTDELEDILFIYPLLSIRKWEIYSIMQFNS